MASIPAGTRPREKVKSSRQTSPGPDQRPTSFSRKVRLTLFAIAIVSAVALYTRPVSPTPSEAYAMCGQGTRKPVYTVDPNNTQVQCLVVRGARVVDTGALDDIKSRWDGPELQLKYLGDSEVVVPGLSDSHCHILEYGASQLVDLQSGQSAEETVQILADYINADLVLSKDRTKVVEGWGYDHTSWDIPVLPSAADFEANPTTQGRQIILSGRDGHSVWVSATTLAANAPYPADTEVAGGVIVRDENGLPTGAFLDTAMDLVKRPNLTHSDLGARFQTTVKHALGTGLTSLHDAGFDPQSFAFFTKETEHGPLPLRIYGMRYFNVEQHAPYWGNTTQPLLAAYEGDEEGTRLSSRSVKIFADGALRSGGAALYEPYADNPSTSGLMRIAPELLHRVVPGFLRDGWQVNIHAIGDRANGIILDTFERAQQELGINIRALRPRIEHVQLLTQKDMRRLGDLGVIASVQPTHATDDMWYAQDRLGPERVKGLYAFRGIVDGGARITLGSDFPVADVNALAGFYAAITRVAKDGTSPHGPGGWFPEQRLTRIEALRGMTIDPAYASFTDKHLGSLERGKRADYVVLSKDIMSVSPQDILTTKVRATVIDGRVAYGTL
ncbi:amidohydrolase family-domain-containing protein [Lyophyllum atratum]|nr:amidohydrolase family-domain-containing protein [Lyophyllum atratum]